MIVQILDHWIVPEKIEQARELFAANTKIITKVPGILARYVLRSKKDPLKWTTIAIWEDEKGVEAWDKHPEHIWDRYGYPLECPKDTEVLQKLRRRRHGALEASRRRSVRGYFIGRDAEIEAEVRGSNPLGRAIFRSNTPRPTCVAVKPC